MHIFWQKRIRPGDQTTPWWFPSKTKGGSIREDRLAAARELRDRYLEAVNNDPTALLPQGKYDVARALPDLSAQTNPSAAVASAGVAASSRAVDVAVIPATLLQLPAAA